jgi:hypothetical protein
MERKKKLKVIQLSLLFVGVIIFFLTYSKDIFLVEKKNLTKIARQEVLDLNIDDNSSKNIFYNIEYSGLDLSGNRYKIKAISAKTNTIDENLIDMSGVTATFFFKDGTILNINSELGEYNNSTFDIKFSKNIIADYEKSSLEAQYAEYSNSLGFLTISDNVVIEDLQGNLVADKLVFDINNQNLKIEKYKDDRISIILKTNEKSF